MSECGYCDAQPPIGIGRLTEWTCPQCAVTWRVIRRFERDGWRVAESKTDGNDLIAVVMIKDSGTTRGELCVRTWVSDALAADEEAYKPYLISVAEEEMRYRLEEDSQ